MKDKKMVNIADRVAWIAAGVAFVAIMYKVITGRG